LDPAYAEDAMYHSLLGRSLLALGRTDEAEDELSRARDLFVAKVESRNEFERTHAEETLKVLRSLRK
jgi:hypothetical protein